MRLGEALAAAGFGDVARIDNLGAVVPLSSEADAAQLLAHLVGVGVPVSSFAPAVGDLEHVFHDLNRAGPPPAASDPDPASPFGDPARPTTARRRPIRRQRHDPTARPAHEGFLAGMWLIVTLDLKQRVRGVAWYVLLGVFVLLVTIVTALLVLATNAWDDGGGGVFSTIVFFVLLLGTLVSPALSGNAINGERDAGTLATTQVTLISTAQLVVGKWVAAWLTALTFLAASLPFLVFAVALGQVSAATIAISVLVLALELGIIAAIGVGLSGLLTRPLFSVTVTYLVVAALSIGTLIGFGLGGAAIQTTVRQTYIGVDWRGARGGRQPSRGRAGAVPPTRDSRVPDAPVRPGVGHPGRQPVRRRGRCRARLVRRVRQPARRVQLDRRGRADRAAPARDRCGHR